MIRVFWSVCLLFLLATLAGAAELADYQKRIRSARGGVQELLSNVAKEEADEEPDLPANEVFAMVRELLPAEETVTGPSGDTKTNNQWFVDSLKAAEEEKDLTKRAEMLSKIDARLAAIGVELQAVSEAAAAERSKDEDKRKLAEILSRPEFQKPAPKEPEESWFDKWVREFLQWLEQYMPKFAPGTAPDLSGGVSIVQYLLIGLIILLLGFLAYKLAPLFAPRFRRKEKSAKESRVIMGETIHEDVSSSDLFSDAERLAREGDLRGAIRKGYVALLCEMSDRKLIGLARHKTNRDYLRDVRSRREIHSEMTGLTGSFERHWYGSEDANTEDWEEFRRRCGDTIKAI
jgi:hypothetical protein